MAVPDSRVQRAYRTRVPLFLLAVILAIVALVVGYQGIQTLRVLDLVERDRDRWQQAREVIEQLNLKDGSVAADVGSGAGYFALKLAPSWAALGNGRSLRNETATRPANANGMITNARRGSRSESIG